MRRGATIAAFVNSCPHTGGPLDWVEDQFVDLDRRHILCATHGALFRIEDGHCLAGPCKGKRLTAVAVVVTEGEVRSGRGQRQRRGLFGEGRSLAIPLRHPQSGDQSLVRCRPGFPALRE